MLKKSAEVDSGVDYHKGYSGRVYVAPLPQFQQQQPSAVQQPTPWDAPRTSTNNFHPDHPSCSFYLF